MKKFFKFMFDRPILILFILILLIFVPPMFVMQPQSQIKLIARTIGIDKVGDEIEVTIIYYQPSISQAYTESYNLVSAKGSSLSLALDLAADYTGKQLVLAHMNNVAVSNDIAEENLVKYLNHLIRAYTINNSINVFITNVNAKDFLKDTLKSHGKTANQESGIVEHNDKYIVGTSSNIENIMLSSYGPNKTALIDMLNVSEKEGEDLSGGSQSNASSNSSSGGGSSAGSGGGGEESKPKYLANDGSVAIIRDGKKVGDLTRQEVEALNVINGANEWPKIELKNYSDENFNNATIVFNVPNKYVKYKAYFDGDTPTVLVKTNMLLTIYEVLQNSQTKTIFSQKNLYLNETMQKAISDKLKSNFYPVYQKLQDLNADAFDFYSLFHKKYQKEFDNYLQSLENPEEYIKGIKVILQVESKGK